ncbi:hypothetical protein EYF80_040032 [Liparis tanakae]|uniref:Uncharacterized protein n=1 Tax=Liparis tanakae TaxID=230148 RepID=A0A4Z2G978_9TELE|nr:hypothetical protein EYF80_040032 [Liparis tanakae]
MRSHLGVLESWLKDKALQLIGRAGRGVTARYADGARLVLLLRADICVGGSILSTTLNDA